MKKKLTNAQIEAKLRAMYLEDIKDEIMPLEEMKKRAISEYEVRHRMEQRKQKSSISHRLAIVVGIAICLIGGSFLFSALAPTMVSSANDFTRRAGIWINDVFQLGIVVETPLERPDNGLGNEAKTQTEFSSVEEASKYFGVPLLMLKGDEKGYTLEAPVATLGMEPFYSLEYSYIKDTVLITFSFERILENTEIDIYGDASQISTSIGEAFVMAIGDATLLVTIRDAYALSISTMYRVDELVSLLNSFEWTN